MGLGFSVIITLSPLLFPPSSWFLYFPIPGVVFWLLFVRGDGAGCWSLLALGRLVWITLFILSAICANHHGDTGSPKRGRSVKQVRRYPRGQDGVARETEEEVNEEYEWEFNRRIHGVLLLGALRREKQRNTVHIPRLLPLLSLERLHLVL